MCNLEPVYTIEYQFKHELNGEIVVDNWIGAIYFNSVEDAHDYLTINSYKIVPSENPLAEVLYDGGTIQAQIVTLNKYNRSDYN